MKDYKAEYLKYKFKYLKTKSNKLNNKLKGGNILNNEYVIGLSAAALFAGAIYYIYTKQYSKAIEYTDELKNKDLDDYEKARLKELTILEKNSHEKNSHEKDSHEKDSYKKLYTNNLFPKNNKEEKYKKTMESKPHIYEKIAGIKPAKVMSEEEKKKMNIEEETLNEMIKIKSKDGKPVA